MGSARPIEGLQVVIARATGIVAPAGFAEAEFESIADCRLQ